MPPRQSKSKQNLSLPRTLRIGGHKVVIYQDGETLSDIAEYVRKTNIIRVNPTCSPDIQAEGLLHEVFECLAAMDSIQMDHATLSTLSEGVFGALIQNWPAFRLIFDQAARYAKG